MKYKFVLLFLFLFSFSLRAEWVHVELGAGNYGEAGGEDYQGTPRGPHQYLRLYEALENMIKTKGAKGTIYLNDINRHAARFAARKLHEYCVEHGHREIEIRVLSGDLTKIDLPQADSIHLRHPEPFFLNDAKTLAPAFQNIANHSKQGLEITTYAHDRFSRFFTKGLNISVTNKNPAPYLTPAGVEHTDGDGFVPSAKTYTIAPSVTEPIGRKDKLGYSTIDMGCDVSDIAKLQ